MKKIAIFLLLIATSCAYWPKSTPQIQNLEDYPEWYLSPKVNNSQEIYGVGEGFTFEEATKSALADAASRLSVTISATSTLLRQENNFDSSEDTRRKIQQNIEKIDFPGFRTSETARLGEKIYLQVAIDRQGFIRNQQRKIRSLSQQIVNLQDNLSRQNIVRQKVALEKILELAKHLEVTSRIIDDEPIISESLRMITNAQNLVEKITDKIEVYFVSKGQRQIYSIIKGALNKEGIKITTKDSESKNQLKVAVRSSRKTSEIYDNFITKTRIEIDNYSGNKIIASNLVEVSGSSTIGESESYDASLESLKEKIDKDGVLKVLGVL